MVTGSITLTGNVPNGVAGRPAIFATYREAVLLVHSRGELFNGRVEEETGSGFLISGTGLALTSAHVVLNDPDNYRAMTVTVRRGKRTADPHSARVVAYDPQADIALLQIDKMKTDVFVPLGVSDLMQEQAWLAVLGFPLIYGLNVTEGVLSNRDKADRWLTTNPLNPGNSGGPVFNDRAEAIGIVSGGATSATLASGETIRVDGINFFVPIDRFRTGIAERQGISLSKPALALRDVKPGEMIARAYEISQMKDDHIYPEDVLKSGKLLELFEKRPRDFSPTFEAEDGYEITNAEIQSHSANNATGIKTEILDQGRKVRVDFKLTSGPPVDRYRAWLHATVVTQQRKKN